VGDFPHCRQCRAKFGPNAPRTSRLAQLTANGCWRATGSWDEPADAILPIAPGRPSAPPPARGEAVAQHPLARAFDAAIEILNERRQISLMGKSCAEPGYRRSVDEIKRGARANPSGNRPPGKKAGCRRLVGTPRVNQRLRDVPGWNLKGGRLWRVQHFAAGCNPLRTGPHYSKGI